MQNVDASAQNVVSYISPEATTGNPITQVSLGLHFWHMSCLVCSPLISNTQVLILPCFTTQGLYSFEANPLVNCLYQLANPVLYLPPNIFSNQQNSSAQSQLLQVVFFYDNLHIHLNLG